MKVNAAVYQLDIDQVHEVMREIKNYLVRTTEGRPYHSLRVEEIQPTLSEAITPQGLVIYIGFPNASIICERLPLNAPDIVRKFVDFKWAQVVIASMEAFLEEFHDANCPNCSGKDKPVVVAEPIGSAPIFWQRDKGGVQ